MSPNQLADMIEKQAEEFNKLSEDHPDDFQKQYYLGASEGRYSVAAFIRSLREFGK